MLPLFYRKEFETEPTVKEFLPLVNRCFLPKKPKHNNSFMWVHKHRGYLEGHQTNQTKNQQQKQTPQKRRTCQRKTLPVRGHLWFWAPLPHGHPLHQARPERTPSDCFWELVRPVFNYAGLRSGTTDQTSNRLLEGCFRSSLSWGGGSMLGRRGWT